MKWNKVIAYVLAVVLIGLLIWMITNQVREHHLQDDPMLHLLKELAKPIHPVFEKMQLYKGDKSYTINKEKTFMCLYDENNQYYPSSILLYCLIHEAAHVLNTKDIGHTENFYKVFDELLKRAIELGIYNPSIPLVQNYCGHS